jgi:hypothetical protein
MNEIVTVAESLIPLIRELRRTIEQDRRIAEPNIAPQLLWLEDAGRVLVGHEPINPLFMI